VKRALDIVLGTIALVVAAPVILACAIFVKLDSRGPAFYRPLRAGQAERPFRQLKLRTMHLGSDAAGFRTSEGDRRITRAGAFLRRTSLDELPQVWNVVRGDMSLVGPRPAPAAQLDEYTAVERRLRQRVRPGITGLAQVSGRSGLTLTESLALDIDYATHASAIADLRILLRTVGVVLSRRGTN
jgi:lipopolysaccharide/colanic/teichoic acid biosynthesis glycosyltransferase